MKKIYIDESPAGSGKTHRAIDWITCRTCKILFVTERIEMLDELEIAIRWSAARHYSNPVVVKVHSGQSKHGISIGRRIAALPGTHAEHDHVIVLATHSAMLRSDFSGFAGWEIIVDEVPPFLDSEPKKTHLDAAFFRRFYHLEANGQGWSVVTPTDQGRKLTVQSLRRDESHAHMAPFHGRVLDASRGGAKRTVICDLPSWEAMENDDVEWCWASAFSLRELDPFDKVTLLGNRFRSDIGCIFSQTLEPEPIEWIELPPLERMGEFSFRPVNIRYFSEGRTSSGNLFSDEAGIEMLRKIGSYLAGHLPAEEYIWSANDGANSPRSLLEEAGMRRLCYLTPRQAGSNKHAAISSAAMIYSAKPTPGMEMLLKSLGIDPALWTRSIEHEAILQFVTRTSVRDPDNASPVNLWVFDREQAQYLKDYFDGLPYVAATMAWIEDGPNVPRRGKSGPKKVIRTPEEQKAHDAEKRAVDAARKRRERAEEKLRKAEGKLKKAA